MMLASSLPAATGVVGVAWLMELPGGAFRPELLLSRLSSRSGSLEKVPAFVVLQVPQLKIKEIASVSNGIFGGGDTS